MPQIASEIIDVYSMTEGLNTVKSGVRIGPNELKNCQNIRFNPIGGFKWRQGYSAFGDFTGSAVTGLYMARFHSGTNVAFRTQGAKIEKMDSLDGTWDNITGALSLTSGQNNLFQFDILNDKVVAVNGADSAPIQVSSALSASTIAGLPFTAASSLFQHRGYMFYIAGDELWFSDVNDPTTVGATHFIRVGYKQGGSLVAGLDFNGKACVWKRNGIYGVEFQPTQVDSSGTLFPFVERPEPIVPGVGTQSKMSLCKFTTPATHKSPGQELVFFLDQFGVPRLFDGSTTLAIGAAILTSRDENIISLSNTERTRLPYAWVVNDAANNLIYCFVTGTDEVQTSRCWILDYTTSFAWARDSYAHNFNAGAIFENNDGVFKPYFGGYDGQVWEMNSGQLDYVTAITSYARSGDLYVKSPVIQSKWIYNEIRGSAGNDGQNVTINYYKDGEDSASATGTVNLFKENQAMWDEFNWDQDNWVYSGLTTKSSEINLECKTLSVEFRNETASNTATIEGYSLFVIPEGWKQEQ